MTRKGRIRIITQQMIIIKKEPISPYFIFHQEQRREGGKNPGIGERVLRYTNKLKRQQTGAEKNMTGVEPTITSPSKRSRELSLSLLRCIMASKAMKLSLIIYGCRSLDSVPHSAAHRPSVGTQRLYQLEHHISLLAALR
jgi:hypothetical protein